jgi:endoglycosylceramidase
VKRIACVLGALGLAIGGLATPAMGSPSVPSQPPPLPALHAVPDPVRGGRIVDAAGREVLLRGVNVNAEVDYWKGTSFATTFPFTEPDAVRMAAIGWNTARLLVSWSRVEPTPGHYDDAYLDKVASDVRTLARHRIYAIIDFHQDAWGPTLAAPFGAPCPDGSTRALGWDGAPGWATQDGGAARCAPAGVREISPAVLAAFKAFWDNAPGPGGVGIRTRYARMVGHVAGRFARTSSVAGYDVMNEPNAYGPDQAQALGDLYASSVRSISRAEDAAGGRHHLVLFEPSIVWSDSGRGLPPVFTSDPGIVYAPHLYMGGFDGGPITAEQFQRARDDAAIFGGAPIVSGEWGSGPDRAAPSGDRYFLDHQALQDGFRVGATLWTWRESCGDPHKVGDFRAGRIPSVWGEFDVDCRTNTVTGVRTDLVRQLKRAYVRAAPGRLLRDTYDPATKHLSATGYTGRAGLTLEAFFPARPGNVAVAVDGLGSVRLTRTEGGATLLTARTTGGAWRLRVARD